MSSANEIWLYIVTSPLTGWAHTQKDPCILRHGLKRAVFSNIVQNLALTHTNNIWLPKYFDRSGKTNNMHPLGSQNITKHSIKGNKANLRDLTAGTSLAVSNWIQIVNFSARVTMKFYGWPRKTKDNSSILLQALCIISNPLVNSNWVYSPETLNSGQNWWYVIQCVLEIWWMTLENNRAPLLCYFKLCATFCSHWWIQTGVTVWKHPIWVKFDDFQSRVT